MSDQVPECIVDAPREVVEAARRIASDAVVVLRESLRDNIPGLDVPTLDDLTRAVCLFMAEDIRRGE